MPPRKGIANSFACAFSPAGGAQFDRVSSRTWFLALQPCNRRQQQAGFAGSTTSCLFLAAFLSLLAAAPPARVDGKTRQKWKGPSLSLSLSYAFFLHNGLCMFS